VSKPIAYNPQTVVQVQVTDFKRAVSWFKEMLGFEEEYLMEEMGWGELKTAVPGLTLGVSVNPEAKGHDGVTVVLSVQDIAVARESLESKGVKFDGPTDEIPGMVRLATFRDPDNNPFMFSQSLG